MATDNLLGSLELVGTVASVRMARAFVRWTLGMGHPALEDVTLLVSELTTNAVLHSDSRDGGPVSITLLECDHAIRVIVRDSGSDSRPRVSDDLCGEGGRGLFLVEEISQCWGVDEDAAGRAVWCEVKV
ncbi:MAG: putative anti-sigma regulatory factor, serine/threonine protein kinase [Sphaerisporangium sp.]|jgi:anti-sigma regulatory factor (Ser/Thr protein kinase)|nr:putative anti-sigma regulatory factor, serine/threonine protein kinase [Sphaerisporangium sp.]